MRILKTKSSRIVLSVCSVSLFFLALIWVSYVRQNNLDRKDALRFAIEKNSNLAVVLEQYTISTLHNADDLLQMIRMEWMNHDSGTLRTIVAKNSLNKGFIEGILVIGRDGRLIMSNRPYSGDSLPDFSDRAYFQFHLRHTVDTLLISKPILSKYFGNPVIVVSRRLYDSKGGFAGLVALQLKPSSFTSFYAQAHLLPNDIISLISPDGATYSRRTGTVESSGEDISKSPLFRYAEQNPDGSYFAKDAIKQIPTWFSYRRLKEYPIIATVGSSQQDILSSHMDRQVKFLVPRIIVSVLVILFSFLISFFLLHRRRLSDQILKDEERYEKLLTEQMIAVQEREREWIGRELHDNVNQVLTTVKLYLEMAGKNVDDPFIPRSMQLINSTIGEIRNLSHQLSAPTLGTRSLIDSINALIEMIGLSTSLQFEFDHSRYDGQLKMNQKLTVYRIIQEQVNNIIKHAEATRVWISLAERDGKVTLIVRDNGKGFDRQAKMNGMGINNIISRAKILGGTVNIESALHRGCRLSVVVPVIMEEEPVSSPG